MFCPSRVTALPSLMQASRSDGTFHRIICRETPWPSRLVTIRTPTQRPPPPTTLLLLLLLPSGRCHTRSTSSESRIQATNNLTLLHPTVLSSSSSSPSSLFFFSTAAQEPCAPRTGLAMQAYNEYPGPFVCLLIFFRPLSSSSPSSSSLFDSCFWLGFFLFFFSWSWLGGVYCKIGWIPETCNYVVCCCTTPLSRPMFDFSFISIVVRCVLVCA